MLLSPPLLLGVLLCLFALVFYLRSGPPRPPELVQIDEAVETPQTEREEVQLLTYDLGPNDEWLESPRFAEIDASPVPARRYASIVSALEAVLGGGVWPAALDLPTVIVAGEGERDETVVLDFTVDDPLAVSVQDEERLLMSLRGTLEKAGAERVRVLINHRPSSSFLGHIELEPSLE